MTLNLMEPYNAVPSVTEPTPEGAYRPPILSLFCGPGGLDQGFWEAGFRIPLAGDISKGACLTHAHNHGPHGTNTLHLDVADTTVDQLVDQWQSVCSEAPVGIIGGPPCQAFSHSNVHKKDDDPRSQLPSHYARLIKGIKDKLGLDFFLFENVPGLLSHRHKAQYLGFKDDCAAAGFRVFEKVVDAVRFGVPQYRERVIIVGLNADKYPNVVLDLPEGHTEPVPIDAALLGLPEPRRFERGLRPEDVPFHPNHWCMAPKSVKFTNGKLQQGVMFGRSFRTLKWGEPSWTVAYGHREVHVHPNCDRRLSMYEALRLQGFPTNYELKGTLSQQITQVSDAVPPPVGYAMALAIKKALRFDYTTTLSTTHIVSSMGRRVRIRPHASLLPAERSEASPKR